MLLSVRRVGHMLPACLMDSALVLCDYIVVTD